MLRGDFKVYQDLEEQEVIDKALRRFHIVKSDLIEARIAKKSIDARDKQHVCYHYVMEFTVVDEDKYPRLTKVTKRPLTEAVKRRDSVYQPIIVGAGPAGLFCALTLVEYGYKPIIIEQGSKVDKRIEEVNKYRQQGFLNTRCNVQFGEGGAGTFSDGKLTTGINSPYIVHVLNTFYHFGAPKEITYLAHPHIGTDNLVHILTNMRKHIESKGGQYLFDTKLTNIEETTDGLIVDCQGQKLKTDCLVLAIGHSARDTLEMLQQKGMSMKRKNFSVGVRIEHLQEDINKAQYGTITSLHLPPAEYKLVYHGKERTCYSFCMCPGGEVIASSSDEGAIVTNGMSNFARDGENANSALLVNVNTDDLVGDDPLEGIRFQRDLEEKAFKLAGCNYFAPVQRFQDFNDHVASTYFG